MKSCYVSIFVSNKNYIAIVKDVEHSVQAIEHVINLVKEKYPSKYNKIHTIVCRPFNGTTYEPL